jgi:hypothetical protein
MTKENIELYWKHNFKKCPPINYLFKVYYTDRWLRIHSLPDSKRYADTAAEWDVLFGTQNTILEDIFEDDNSVCLFTGVYSSAEITFAENNFSNNEFLKAFDFKALEKIDLYAISKDYCEKNTFFTPYFVSILFKKNNYNELLKAIANDGIRAFFLSSKTNTIIAPYDGGVDIIYKDTQTRDFYKNKYSHFTQQDNFR